MKFIPLKDKRYKLNPNTLQDIRDYIDGCKDEYKVLETKTGAKKYLHQVQLPSQQSLCLKLKISTETMAEWQKTHGEVAELLVELKHLQHQRLTDNALQGLYNPIISKLILATHHGYAESKNIGIGNKDGIPFVTQDISKLDDKQKSAYLKEMLDRE